MPEHRGLDLEIEIPDRERATDAGEYGSHDPEIWILDQKIAVPDSGRAKETSGYGGHDREIA